MEQTFLVDPQRVAAGEVGVGDDDALSTACGYLQLGLDGVGTPLDARGHAALDVLHVAHEA